MAPVVQQEAPDQPMAPSYTESTPVEDILKVMTFEEAQNVVVDSGRLLRHIILFWTAFQCNLAARYRQLHIGSILLYLAGRQCIHILLLFCNHLSDAGFGLQFADVAVDSTGKVFGSSIPLSGTAPILQPMPNAAQRPVEALGAALRQSGGEVHARPERAPQNAVEGRNTPARPAPIQKPAAKPGTLFSSATAGIVLYIIGIGLLFSFMLETPF